MKRSTAAILFVAFLAIIVSCVPADKAAVGTNPIERVENGLFEGAPVAGVPGASLEERMAEFDVPAVSIAVIEDFEVVWVHHNLTGLQWYSSGYRHTGDGIDDGRFGGIEFE